MPRRSGRRTLGWVPVLFAATALVGSLGGVHVARQVRRLRERGLEVDPLAHDLALEGHGPVRHLIVLGDSAAAGHGLRHADEALARSVGRALHARDGRTTVVRSVAVDGATTSDVLKRQCTAASDAEVVLIGVGVNDAVRPHHPIAEVAATLDRLLARLVRPGVPDPRVVLVTCPDLSVAPGLPWLVRPVVGWRCRRLARAQAAVARQHGVTVLDVDRSRLGTEVFGPDGFHPSVEGQRRLAARVVAAVADGPAPGAPGNGAGR